MSKSSVVRRVSGHSGGHMVTVSGGHGAGVGVGLGSVRAAAAAAVHAKAVVEQAALGLSLSLSLTLEDVVPYDGETPGSGSVVEGEGAGGRDAVAIRAAQGMMDQLSRLKE